MRRLKVKCSPMSLLTLTRSRQWNNKRMVYILLAGNNTTSIAAVDAPTSFISAQQAWVRDDQRIHVERTQQEPAILMGDTY
jgi:hypothetical protein